MKKLFYFILIGLLISCKIEDDNAPQPDEQFIKYYGILAEQEAKDIEPIFTADSTAIDGYVIFGTQQLADSSVDYYVVRTDPEGNKLYENSFGLRDIERIDIDGNGDPDLVSADEIPGQITSLGNGNGFLAVGTSQFSIPTQNIVDYSLITFAVLNDTLGVRGVGAIRAGNNLTQDIFGNDILLLSDNSFLIIGTRERDDETNFDFYYTRRGIAGLSGEDTTFWERTSGSNINDDVLVRAFENDDQSISMFGYSEDPGVNGEQGTNVTFVKVNQNGIVQNSNSNGIPENPGFPNVIYSDFLSDVVEIPGGYAVTGTTVFSDNRNFAFFMSLGSDGIAISSDTLTSEFFVTTEGTDTRTNLQTQGLGITAGITNDFVIVGQYPNYRTDTESRSGEAMFYRVNQVGEKIEGYESNFGLGDGNDVASDAITLSDGKIVVAGTVDFGGGVKMISLIKLNDTGQIDQ